MIEKVGGVIPLKKRVLIYFSLVIFLIGVISSILYFNMVEAFDQFNNVYSNLNILEDYSDRIEKISNYLDKYLDERDPTIFFNYYSKEYDYLYVSINNTRLTFINDNDNMMFENVKHMVETYGDEVNSAIIELRRRNISSSSNKLSHAAKIRSYIQQNINELILSYISEGKIFQKNLLQRLTLLKSLIILLILMSMTLYILLAAYFNRGLLKPIDALVEMASKISKGNFDVDRVDISSSSEFKILADTLYNMSHEIKNFINEIKEKAEVEKLLHIKEMENIRINSLLKETELRRLQAQVNPHFLFNTLTILHNTAFLEGANETCEIAEAISKIMRYNLRKINTVVCLKDEIENVKHYIYIQEKRYKHRVCVKFFIDEEALNLPIPTMTIQPVVENSFIHGVEKNEEKGQISISVYLEGDYTIVEVKDNGAGMDEKKVNDIMSMVNNECEYRGHTSGLGINNVVRRLQAFYNKQDILRIESVPKIGTVIKLILPAKFDTKSQFELDYILDSEMARGDCFD